MTNRLYYDDCYCRSFSAIVTECVPVENGYRVVLDQSAFYPTSGGQPYDTGTLADAHVLDVQVAPDGDVWHITDKPLLPGSCVEGCIDWPRRWDHMQQHAGEHMLAGVVWHKLHGHTIGLHLGQDASTIDVELPDGSMRVSDEVLRDLEETVNSQIQQDLPIRCWFPTPEEMERAPLRKPPTVKEHIRLVQVGDVECVACGGTHPSSSGQIGLVKILDARPARGKMRLTFVCGMRAYHDYQKRTAFAEQAAELLSTGVETLPVAVERTLDRMHEAEHTLKQYQLKDALQKAQELSLKPDVLPDGTSVVRAVLPGLDKDGLREVSTFLTGHGIVSLLASSAEDGAILVFSAPAGSRHAMGSLLSSSAKPHGGKGGGRPDYAQGAGPGDAVLSEAWNLLNTNA